MIFKNQNFKSQSFEKMPFFLMSLLFNSTIIDFEIRKSIVLLGLQAPSQPT